MTTPSMKTLLFALLLLVIVDFPAAFAQPQVVESLRQRYFVVVWGYEGDGNAPRDSHTFATFYKEKPHNITKRDFVYADGSVHRLISDLSVFAGKQATHNLIVAGDLNILHGYGEDGDAYWAARYETVFSRMVALGLEFVGPQAPYGRRADPWPEELPRSSNNVPTYHTKQQTPATCTRQLDFAFASRRLVPRVRVRALNEPEQWGPSDHCRIDIEVARL